MFDKAFFDKQDAKGMFAEKLFAVNGWRAGYFTKARKKDYRTTPYDLDIWMKDGTLKKVEVKFADDKGYDNFYAETLTIDNNKEPEYLTHHIGIDWIVYFSSSERMFYVYDCSKFAAYVKCNKSRATINRFGTAKGIIFPKRCKDAGFITILPVVKEGE